MNALRRNIEWEVTTHTSNMSKTKAVDPHSHTYHAQHDTGGRKLVYKNRNQRNYEGDG